MLLKTEFTADTYDTPENTPRSVWEYVSLGTPLSFYIRNFYVFSCSGYRCRKGIFSDQDQVDYSLKNVRIVESCGGKFHLRGLDNLSRFPEPAVMIGNHMSFLETAVMHAFVRPRRDFCFVIKSSLLDVPFFGDIMRQLECIPVDRVNPREDFKAVMDLGKERLQAGKSVIIFPQSTRSATFDPSQFNTIGIKLARHADAPIIPFALRTDFLNNGRLVKDLGPIRRERPIWFEFSEPIMKVSGKEEHAHIVDFIKNRLETWGGRIAVQT